MQKPIFQTLTAIVAALGSVVSLSGCAVTVKSADLKKPEKTTCIDVPLGIEAHETKGLLDRTTILISGPYFSEFEDTDGTYYRAPAGGISDRPNKPGSPSWNFDGGIWVPRSPGKSVHLYTYFSTQSATTIPLPQGASCLNAAFVTNRESQGVSVVEFATAGAIGGATGGAIARTTGNSGSIGYGKAVGVGAASGAIAGGIVASIINLDVGKIIHRPTSIDLHFSEELERITKTVVPVPLSVRQSREPK